LLLTPACLDGERERCSQSDLFRWNHFLYRANCFCHIIAGVFRDACREVVGNPRVSRKFAVKSTGDCFELKPALSLPMGTPLSQ